MKRSTGGVVRRARTSAKEGSLFFLLCVQSSGCFSSILDDGGGAGRGLGGRGPTKNGGRWEERETTLQRRHRQTPDTATTATAYDHHTFEGCQRWQKLSLLPYGRFESSAARPHQPQPERGPSRLPQQTYAYVANGSPRFQEFHPILLPNYQKA